MPSQEPTYNPTASLAGFLLKYAGRESELFATGVRLAKEAYAFLFIHSKDSPFYPQNKELCDFECEFLPQTQEADGTWKITWEWENDPEQWHISKNWWKSDLILKNVKFYKAMKE